MANDRTFVITAPKDIRADDVDIKAGDRVAMVTGLVRPGTLFGLMQYHGFRAEEVPVDDDSEAAAEAAIAAEESAAAQVDAASVRSDASPAADSQAQGESIDASYPTETPAVPVDPAVAAFIADGLDEKIAHILVEQNKLDPAGLRALIDEGFDLIELEGIGTARVEKIMAVYGPKS